MIPLLLGRKSVPMKKELFLILGVLFVVLLLPCIAVVSITNASALIGGPNGNGTATLYTDPAYPGDWYAYGNCTYWAAMRRAQVGEPIPNTWGNAATWAIRALLDGYRVDHTPTQYAIMQTPDVDNGLGHVAFVETIDLDGTWHISEMNVIGFDEVDYRAMPASAAKDYDFIHEKE